MDKNKLQDPKVAVPFVERLSVDAEQIITDWLATHAPQEMEDLFRGHCALNYYSSFAGQHEGQVDALLNRDILEEMTNTINAMTALGVNWRSGDSPRLLGMPISRAAQVAA